MASQPTARAEVTLHPRPSPSAEAITTTTTTNPLPQLLHTPTGLALLELQGTINLPPPPSDDDDDNNNNNSDHPAVPINIGRIDFPDYRPDSITFDASSTAWMRRAYLYVGPHQRLTGEVKKLPRPIAVVRRRGGGAEEEGAGVGEDLEVVEIVRYKIVFSSRPEPVGTD